MVTRERGAPTRGLSRKARLLIAVGFSIAFEACAAVGATVQSAPPPSPADGYLPSLPRIAKLQTCRITFVPAGRLEEAASVSGAVDVIEFIIETDGEVPARAYGPALFVGDVEVNQSQKLDKTTWRLRALEPDQLKTGALISWGWMKAPESNRHATDFRYQPEGSVTSCVR